MRILDILLKIAGKENFELDQRIGTSYIMRLCCKYGCMVIRGRFLAFGHKNIARSIFIGKDVRLYEKKYLKLGDNVKLHDGVKIDSLCTDGVSIADYSVIGRDTIIECTGGLSRIGKGLIIGNRTTFGNNCFFGAAGGIQIGDDVIAGQFVRFHSENHNYENIELLIREQGVTHKGIIIGDNCWIGAGAVFLDGAVLGEGCVVAANAVVTKTFPPNSVIGGVPAKVLKERA